MDLPPKQTNYQIALDQALEGARKRTPESIVALGARRTADGCYDLPVLNTQLTLNLPEGTITRPVSAREDDADDGSVGLPWQVMALHYIAAPSVCPEAAQWLAFADFVEIRGYESVYRGRVLGRLCATVGRDEGKFTDACRRLGAEPVALGDKGFRFQVFPHLAIAIAWYRGDDEFPPNATFLYPDNILTFLPLEDVIVLSECLVSRLQGKGW